MSSYNLLSGEKEHLFEFKTGRLFKNNTLIMPECSCSIKKSKKNFCFNLVVEAVVDPSTEVSLEDFQDVVLEISFQMKYQMKEDSFVFYDYEFETDDSLSFHDFEMILLKSMYSHHFQEECSLDSKIELKK